MSIEIEKYIEELQQIQDFLEESIDNTDANVLCNRLSQITIYLPRLCAILPELKNEQQVQIVKVIEENKGFIANLKMSVANKFLEGKTHEINKFVNWCEYLYKTMVHIGDNMRTQISFAKQEMVLSRSGY